MQILPKGKDSGEKCLKDEECMSNECVLGKCMPMSFNKKLQLIHDKEWEDEKINF